MTPIVVNKYKEPYDVYIGRGSKFGNPFPIGAMGCTRYEAIARYRVWLWDQLKSGSITKEDILQLEGKKLGCFCKPYDCHGDVIVKAYEWLLNRSEQC